jgi:hypothetical protein
VGRAEADGAPPLVRAMLLTAARAMLDKLDGFGVCQSAMDAKDVDALKAAISAMNEGWWMMTEEATSPAGPSPGGPSPGGERRTSLARRQSTKTTGLYWYLDLT